MSDGSQARARSIARQPESGASPRVVVPGAAGSGTSGASGASEALRSRRWFVRALGAGLLLTMAPAPLALSGCDWADAVLRGKRTVTDDAGRENTIPTPQALERVYFTSAIAQIFCFTLNPAVLAGTGIQFTQRELQCLPEGTADLPYMGSLSGGGQIDREALIAEDVQLVFSASAVGLTADNISDADKLQGMTGIPTLLVDGSFEHISDAYRFMGDVLGTQQRAEEIAAYCEDIYARVTQAVAQVSEGERVSLYYAEGPEGLQTEPAESQHATAFITAGADDVAKVEITDDVGMSNVSLEQVIAWDPQVIVAWDSVVRGGADKIIRASDEWGVIRAVREGRVYTMPNTPFAWCDRPPGVNRYLGMQWVANMLYPDYYDVDMVQVVRDFYSKLYWADIDDAFARELLGNSYPPYGRA